MAAIVYQKDKRSGLTYAYQSVSYWDTEKKCSRAHRTLIGRVDKETGQIVPTDGRNRNPKEKRAAESAGRSFCGATYLLDAIGKRLGITEDLRKCFPETYKQVLSIAYYLILEDSTPLYRFGKWGSLHRHPHGRDITSQRSSELFSGITEGDKQRFFSLQAKRRVEDEYWAYDTTTISSYSETLRQAQYGHNKEHDRLPQLNLALLFGERSNLPFYYRKLSGNIPDSKTVRTLLDDLECLGYSRVKLVMDRGFYSEDNINSLYKEHVKFIVSARKSLIFVRRELDAIYDTFRSYEHFSEQYDLYCRTVRTTWDYEHVRPNIGDTLTEQRRIYIHYYFNIEQAAEDEMRFDRLLIALKGELEAGRTLSQHERFYRKYFTVTSTPKRGTHVTVNEGAVRREKRYFGFFALVTNEAMDATTVLETYRNKDVVEKAFGNLKERLSMRRALVSSERGLEGKLFVQFVALIYLSHIKKRMQETGLYRDYTLQGMLDTLDVIECFERQGKAPRVGEMLEKQKELYRAMDVEPPTSL